MFEPVLPFWVPGFFCCHGGVSAARQKSARAVTRTALRIAEEAVSTLMLERGINGESVTICIENGRGIAKINQNSY